MPAVSDKKRALSIYGGTTSTPVQERPVFLRRMDTVVTGVAAEIEHSTARNFCKRNGGLEHTELVQRMLVERSAAFKVLR
jgi:hypothetical protein